MSKLKPLSRAPHGWLSVAFAPNGLEYAVAHEQEGKLSVQHESAAGSATELKLKIPAGDVRVATVVGSDEVLCQTLQLPTEQADELKQMLDLQIDNLTPLPLEEIVYDFEPLETADGKTRVLVALGRKSAINERVQPLESAGLPPELVSVDVVALFRALLQREMLPRDEKLNVLVQLHVGRADVVVFTRGQPVTVRTVTGDGEAAGAAYLWEELRRTVVAVQVEFTAAEMGQLVVVARAEGTQAVAEELAQAWGSPSEILSNGTVPSLAASLCVEAGEGRRLNLLPNEWRQRRRTAKTRQTWVRIGIAVAAGYLLVLAGFLVATGIRKAHVNKLRTEKKRVEPDFQRARQLRSELLAMQSQLNDKFSALEILREVSVLLPENVKLSSFTFRRDESLALKGQADSAQSVYDFVGKLQHSELFAEVKLGGGGVRTEGGGLTRFELTATLKSAAVKTGGG